MKERIRREIDQLVNRFGTRNPYVLADYLGLHVIKRQLPEGIAGLVAELWGENYILLDDDLPPPEARYITAHELYHFIDNHPDYLSIKKGYWGNFFETRSDYFAAGLLIDQKPEWGESDVEFAARTEVPLKLVRIWYKTVA